MHLLPPVLPFAGFNVAAAAPAGGGGAVCHFRKLRHFFTAVHCIPIIFFFVRAGGGVDGSYDIFLCQSIALSCQSHEISCIHSNKCCGKLLR
jgi:hypothetical protein